MSRATRQPNDSNSGHGKDQPPGLTDANTSRLRRITVKQKAIAAAVLDFHGIKTNNHQLQSIANLLYTASVEPLLTLSGQRHRRKVHQARLHRLKLLDTLIAAYEAIYVTPEGREGSEDYYTVSRHGSNVTALVGSLRELRVIEATYANEVPEPLPRARPQSGKSAGSEGIFNILSELGVSPWRASGIIADMLICSEIEPQPRNKVQRALYDRLSRPLRGSK